MQKWLNLIYRVTLGRGCNDAQSPRLSYVDDQQTVIILQRMWRWRFGLVVTSLGTSMKLL